MQKSVLLYSILLTFSTLSAQDAPLDWAKGAVWYQIFPERFRNGNLENDPTKEHVFNNGDYDWQVHPWTSDWYKMQAWEADRSSDIYSVVFDRRYGGDLIGVIEKLPYLKELGVDVIYFNPIFESPSLHKYDAATYHHIDNNFGNDRDGDLKAIHSEKEGPSTWTFTQADQVFLKLISKAHELDIKIVIDGVFNHCSPAFWAFQDVIKNQQNSVYKDWFDVISWDDPDTPDVNEFDYNGWWGYKGMPEFKEDSNGLVEPVKKYFFNITHRWMDPDGDGDPSDGVDGWRLDVAKDVSPKFWEEWGQFVKSINPKAITIGEIWEEAPEWIAQKRFDAVMNYPFAKLIVDFFIDKNTVISVSEFDRGLERLRNLYPRETNHILMNLIGGHDTDRIASMIKNPDRDYNQKASLRDNQEYDPRKPDKAGIKIHKLIAIFQMTYPGAPLIYYGDEAGMWGGKDPDDRKPMIWNDYIYEKETYNTLRHDLVDKDEVVFESELFEHYKKLTKIRHENPAIQKGNFVTKIADNDKGLFAYARKYAQNEIIVVLNNSLKDQKIELTIPLPNHTKLTDVLNNKTFQIKNSSIEIAVENKWAAILVRDR